MDKCILPIMVILLLLSSSFVGVSNQIERTEGSQATTSDGDLMDSAWPMFGHDVKHTGRSSYNTADNHGGIKWKFRIEGGIDSSPAISDDGTIYVGGNKYYGPLYAISPDGSEKWHFNTNDGWITSSPSIAEDGTIYFGSWDHYFYAINPNGTLKWKFHVSDNVESSPAIAEDGTIYFGVVGPGFDKGRIYALNPNGTEKWHYDTADYVFSSPSIGNDGTVYISSNDKNLYAMNQNGTKKWDFEVNDWLGSPSIADDGTIYVASWDDYLYAIYPNGTLRWKSGIGRGSRHTPSIAEDGTLYIGDDELYAIYPNGTRKWTFNPGMDFDITSLTNAISADGTIYFGVTKGTERGDIIAVNPDGTERWREEYIANDWVWASPAIGSDGTIYIGSTSAESGLPHGYLYAFGGTKIERPKRGHLYIFNKEVMSTPRENTIIIGKITVGALAFDIENVSKVDFFVDDVKQHEDSSPPFEWIWNKISFSKHTLRVTAYYNQEYNSTDEINVWKFF